MQRTPRTFRNAGRSFGERAGAWGPAKIHPARQPQAPALRRLAGGSGSCTLPPARASSDGHQVPWGVPLSPSGAHQSSSSDSGMCHSSAWPHGHWAHGHPDDSWDFVEDEEPSPPPCNTPTHEDGAEVAVDNTDVDLFILPPRGNRFTSGAHGHDFYSSSGRFRSSRWTVTDRPGVDMRTLPADKLAGLGQVYVILFGVGEQDTEGIYSLRSFADDSGLPQETIIVFEGEEDATRYAGLLEATMDQHVPSVCSIPPAELVDFCVDAGYQCRLEPEGSLLIPPDFNVGVTDWERATRLRQGMFVVLDAEPPARHAPGPAPPSPPAAAAPGVAHGDHPGPLSSVSPARPGGSSTSSLAKYHPSFREDELTGIRNMLELLLPLTATPDAPTEAPHANAHPTRLLSHGQAPPAPEEALMAVPPPAGGPLGALEPPGL